MIEGKNYKILEYQDVFDACEHMEVAGEAIGENLRRINHEGKGEEDRAEFLNDLFTVIAAAGVGAAICKQQGGLVLMKEGITPEEKKEAMEALAKLRPQPIRPVKLFNPGGMPQ